MAEILADYTDFDYKNNFWGSADRAYEDQCDRIALQKLLPKSGEKIADICGGYGRLVKEVINKFSKVYLFDYAQNLLDQAKKEYGDKLQIDQGDAEKLPYPNSVMDVCLFVRASHHFKDLSKLIFELSRVIKPQGKLIIEIANKRHILQVLRFIARRSAFNPFEHQPISRNAKGFYNYHPAYVEVLLKQNNFKIKRVLSVSNFRNNILKRIFGPKFLIILENIVQDLMGLFKLSPSIYYLAEKIG